MEIVWTPANAEVWEDVRVVIFTFSRHYNRTHRILPENVSDCWDLSLLEEGIAYLLLLEEEVDNDWEVEVYDGATVEVNGNEVSFWSQEGPLYLEEE